jgi:hypothetical protein
LHDRLAQSFGRNNIFMDVDHIPAGVDFVAYLNGQVAACDIFLVVIGPNWLEAKDESGRRRLDDPDDFVAIEIAEALARNIRVIPILIDGALMPKASELPDTLKPLARRHALEVRHTQFGRDAEALIAKVREARLPERSLQNTDPSEDQADEFELTIIADRARERARFNASTASFFAVLFSLPLLHYLASDKIVDIDIPVHIAMIPWLVCTAILYCSTFVAPRWKPTFGMDTNAFRLLPLNVRKDLNDRVAGIRIVLHQLISPRITGTTFVILFFLGLIPILKALPWRMGHR